MASVDTLTHTARTEPTPPVSDGTSESLVTQTFLFTDMEGSTAQWESTPEMHGVVERHFGTLHESVYAHGGVVFSTMGDGIAAAFDSAGAAAHAVRDAQQAFVRDGVAVRMGLHTDQWWMPQPSRADAQYRRVSNITRHPAPEFLSPDKDIGIAPPVTVTAVWMLTDFTRQNGATELVPGTHLSGAYPNVKAQEDYEIIQPEARAGTLMLFDGRLWHGNGANIGAPDRLDFTVIGPAVNETARMEAMCKPLKTSLVLSDAVAKHLEAAELVPLGAHPLRGVSGDRALFTLRARQPGSG